MKINVLLNIGRKPSGASRPIVEFCNVLAKFNDVLIYKALNPNKSGFEYLLREVAGFLTKGRSFYPGWMRCDSRITIIPSYKEKFIRDGDIVFFRSPHLAEEVSRWNRSKGIGVMRVSNVHMLKNPVKIPDNIVLIPSSTMVYDRLRVLYPHHRIFKVGNGVNCNFFFYEERYWKSPRSIGMVFYSGKNAKHKGMEAGFEVMKKIREKFPQMKFIVAGLEKERTIPEFVEFVKGSTSQDMLKFYRMVDILIYPSKEDAWPNPPMEAMACGCCVVTTDVGGIRDFARDRENAMICRVDDIQQMVAAVESLIRHPDLWKSLISAGLERIRQFDYSIQGKKLESVFYDILSTS